MPQEQSLRRNLSRRRSFRCGVDRASDAEKVISISSHCPLNVGLRFLGTGTPLHAAAKERKKETVKFLIENGAFLPDDINDSRFNPPMHYCTGLEWAYEEMKRLQKENLSAGEAYYNSES
ncbi:hypothetical protein CRYUN_Cryun12cG0000600 [Craigia yunnanensis]